MPGRYNTYRTPVFPAFAWLVYEVTGVQPRQVYRAQLVLLALAAACLPLLGARQAGNAGFGLGLVSGLLLLGVHARLAETFLTEVMILVHGVALLAVFLGFEAKPTPARAAALGLAAGAGLLVKGSLIFIPPLLGLWIFIQFLRRRWGIAVVGAAAVGMLVLPVVWSMYVSAQAGKPVFVSTQGNRVLLDGNNELAFPDGGWHPEWDGQSRGFVQAPADVSGLYYHREDVRALPVWRQVLGFALANPARMPVLLLNKVGAAFADLAGLHLWMAAWIFLALRDGLLRRLPARRAGPAAALLALVFFLLAPREHYAVTGLLVLATSALWTGLAWFGRPGTLPRLPALAWIVPLNFLLLTLMTFGLRRFTLPGDPLFWLATGLVLVHAFSLLRHDCRPPVNAPSP